MFIKIVFEDRIRSLDWEAERSLDKNIQIHYSKIDKAIY